MSVLKIRDFLQNIDAQLLGIRLFGFFLQEVSTEGRLSRSWAFLFTVSLHVVLSP